MITDMKCHSFLQDLAASRGFMEEIQSKMHFKQDEIEMPDLQNNCLSRRFVTSSLNINEKWNNIPHYTQSVINGREPCELEFGVSNKII